MWALGEGLQLTWGLTVEDLDYPVERFGVCVGDYSVGSCWASLLTT